MVEADPSSHNLEPLRPGAISRFLPVKSLSHAMGAAAGQPDASSVHLVLDVFAERFALYVTTDFARVEGSAVEDVGKPVHAEARAAEVLGSHLKTLVPSKNPAREIVSEAVRENDVAEVPECDVR